MPTANGPSDRNSAAISLTILLLPRCASRMPGHFPYSRGRRPGKSCPARADFTPALPFGTLAFTIEAEEIVSGRKRRAICPNEVAKEQVMEERQAFNPYLPSWEYLPDGEPRLFGDRVYVYGSHDRFNGRIFCMNDYVCWSAPANDLSDWRCEGVIYRRNQDPKKSAGAPPSVCPGCGSGHGRQILSVLCLRLLRHDRCGGVRHARRPVPVLWVGQLSGRYHLGQKTGGSVSL